MCASALIVLHKGPGVLTTLIALCRMGSQYRWPRGGTDCRRTWCSTRWILSFEKRARAWMNCLKIRTRYLTKFNLIKIILTTERQPTFSPRSELSKPKDICLFINLRFIGSVVRPVTISSEFLSRLCTGLYKNYGESTTLSLSRKGWTRKAEGGEPGRVWL